MTAFWLDPKLREYATERQWEVLSAWEKHGSQRRAADALDVHKALLHKCYKAVLKKASLRGYAPEHSAFNANGIPPGFVLRSQSALVGPDGALKARWDKTKQEGAAPEDAVQLPDPKKITKLSSMLDAEGRVIVQWVAEKPEDVTRERAWQEFAKELAAEIPKVEPVAPPENTNDKLLAGYPVGDHHLGMLSWAAETDGDYDMKIAETLLCGAFDYLTSVTSAAEQAVVAFLGDFLHYDSFEAVTPTSRNMLDSDTRYPKMVRTAVAIMRHSINAALLRHKTVHVIVEIGNHDLSSSIFLMECLKVAYENDPRVTVDTSPRHFHYYRFGNVLLGTHHGHGVKMSDLPLTMATDRPEDWGQTEYRYFWTGHKHHGRVEDSTRGNDYSGCVVERFRVLPPSDAWAAQKGYRPYQDMKAIVYHREFGEVARHTINPKMLASKEYAA